MPNLKNFTPTHWLIIGVGIIFAIAIGVFLGTEDCYNGRCATGFEVLKTQWPGFWTWVVMGSIVALVLGYLAWSNATGNGFLGPRLPGTDGFTIFVLILMLIALCGPWGVACGKKANGGVRIETPYQPRSHLA